MAEGGRGAPAVRYNVSAEDTEIAWRRRHRRQRLPRKLGWLATGRVIAKEDNRHRIKYIGIYSNAGRRQGSNIRSTQLVQDRLLQLRRRRVVEGPLSEPKCVLSIKQGLKMFVVEDKGSAIALMCAALLFLGTWPALLTLLERRGRLPQHTYLDYSITNLLAAVLIHKDLL
ncbi:uncharacterized protein [Triticum aestivum]|uniref:uncharacterized protein n=1 Tax=Triticum aestivum TaxID=4565 RepID=UPI001D032274|nr:uncharacterized protein LOC123114597 [Triticum aestivum]